MKKFLVFTTIIIVVFIGAIISILVQTSPASLDEVSIKKVLVKDESVTISGEFISSSSVYRGHTFKTDGDSLYVEIKKSLPNLLHKNGGFSLVVSLDTSPINKVYLMNGDDKLLIWNKSLVALSQNEYTHNKK